MLTTTGTPGNLAGPELFSWQGYLPGHLGSKAAEASSPGSAEVPEGWTETVKARQGKVEVAAEYGIHQSSGPAWKQV